MSFIRTAILALAALACGSPAAFAHPHMLISQAVRFIAKDGVFTHVELEWAFDPMSSDLEILAIDEDKDGKISAREEKELSKVVIPELKRFGYLAWFNTGSKDERPNAPPAFKARIANPASFVPGGWAPVPDAAGNLPPMAGAIMGKGIDPKAPGMRNLIYMLRYALPRPSKSVSVAAIDEEDYIRIEVAPATAFAVEGDGGKAQCKADKHPTVKAEYFRGHPFFADRVTCTLP
jgi:hypothetical protein